MKNLIITCLSFNNNAEEAINFYIDIFNKTFGTTKGESKIIKTVNFGEKELEHLQNVPEVSEDIMPGPVGSVKTIRFLLNEQEFVAVNGGGYFGKFHESMSLYINCESQEQIDILYDALAEGGQMQPCGWVKDRFGVSWQIVPSFVWEVDESNDREAAERMNIALFAMNKVDVEKLREVTKSN